MGTFLIQHELALKFGADEFRASGAEQFVLEQKAAWQAERQRVEQAQREAKEANWIRRDMVTRFLNERRACLLGASTTYPEVEKEAVAFHLAELEQVAFMLGITLRRTE